MIPSSTPELASFTNSDTGLLGRILGGNGFSAETAFTGASAMSLVADGASINTGLLLAAPGLSVGAGSAPEAIDSVGFELGLAAKQL